MFLSLLSACARRAKISRFIDSFFNLARLRLLQKCENVHFLSHFELLCALCETKIYVWGEEEEEEKVCKNSTTSLTIKKALCSL